MRSFENLKLYARHLLKPELFNSVAEENILSIKAQHNAIITNLSPFPEEEISRLFHDNLHNFLVDLTLLKGTDHIHQSFEKWEINNYSIPGNPIPATDIIMAYLIRKDVMIKFIPSYTNDAMVKIKLIDELDAIFHIAKKTGLTYLKAHKQ